jgi:hypothetical protein
VSFLFFHFAGLVVPAAGDLVHGKSYSNCKPIIVNFK